MTAAAMPTCRCGLAMRPASTRDAWECRCGIAVDGAIAESGQPIPDAEFQQGEPWKEPEPGLRISIHYGDIAIYWESCQVDPARFPAPEAWQRMCADAFEGTGLRYIGPVLRTDDFKRPPRAPHYNGRMLILDSGEELKRQAVYALVPLGQEADAVRGIVRTIRDIHGSGRLWAHGDVPIGPLKKRDQAGWRGAEIGGVLHALLGCYYFHQPEATMDKPKRTQECEDQISTAREMPANWQSGTGSGRGPNAAPITEQNRDAERPAPAHPGAPSKLPGYGSGK